MAGGVKLTVFTVGKSRKSWSNEAVAHYAKRLKRWGGVDEQHVKVETFRGDVDAVRRAESERLLARVTPRDRLVVLDERGTDPTTHDFSALLRSCRNDGTHRLVFAIGGAYGHHESLRQAAWQTIRLSRLVLNHEVARVVLFEQLYRAMDLIEGGPYHH